MSVLQKAERRLASQKAWWSLNAFLHQPLDVEALGPRARSKRLRDDVEDAKALDGQLIAIKDNICTHRQPTTCASNILSEYRSPFDATVVRRLEDAGAVIAGKTNLDEFGMGSHSIHSSFGPVRSAVGSPDGAVSAGGSSGGSAVAVATNQASAALGTDTGGSVRLPAAYNGIIGFKPSYGLVSRFGVIAYANSLDTVGILAKSPAVAQTVFGVISGYDHKDPTSLSEKLRSRLLQAVKTRTIKSRIRFGVPLEYNIAELDSDVRDAWLKALVAIRSRGHEVYAVSLPSTKLALSAYYILAPAEASSNLAKYDGVRYGKRQTKSEGPGQAFAPARGQGLGSEVRRRILLGAYSLSASAMDNYFIKAQKVRALVRQDFDRVFGLPNPLLEETRPPIDEGVDVLLSPTAPTKPPQLADIDGLSALDEYRNDIFTVPASLAGLPAISVPAVPVQTEGPEVTSTIGLQLTAQYGDETMLFHADGILGEVGTD